MADPYAPQESDRMAWMEQGGGGLWWLVTAAGIALFALAYVVGFFDRGTHTAAAWFAMLAFLALEAGLTLSALTGARWPWGARVALMLGAALLAVRAVGLGGIGTLF